MGFNDLFNRQPSPTRKWEYLSGTAEMALSRMGPRSRVRANSAEWEPQSGGLGRRGENWEGRTNPREIALYIRVRVCTQKTLAVSFLPYRKRGTSVVYPIGLPNRPATVYCSFRRALLRRTRAPRPSRRTSRRLSRRLVGQHPRASYCSTFRGWRRATSHANSLHPRRAIASTRIRIPAKRQSSKQRGRTREEPDDPPGDLEIIYQTDLAELERLKRQVEHQEVKKEIDRLRAQLEEPPALRTPATIPETQQTTTLASTRHLRSESSEQAIASPRPRKRATVVPIRPPPEYYRNSRAELHEFIEQCEIKFQAEPECYAEDSEKILLARQYLHGRPREDWGLYADRHLAPSWQDFKQCLSNSLPGSANRTQEAMAKYLEARQRADQLAVQFLDYFKRLL